MKKLMTVLISALFAVILFSLCSSASEPWTTYDPDAVPAVIPSVCRARINEDYSISVTFSVHNAGETKAENFSITRASITFGEYTFDLPDQVKGKNISAGKSRKYTVKIPSDAVPEALSYNDLNTCKYAITCEYALGGYWHTFSVNTDAEMIMRW